MLSDTLKYEYTGILHILNMVLPIHDNFIMNDFHLRMDGCLNDLYFSNNDSFTIKY